jgi:hypothetical protein
MRATNSNPHRQTKIRDCDGGQPLVLLQQRNTTHLPRTRYQRRVRHDNFHGATAAHVKLTVSDRDDGIGAVVLLSTTTKLLEPVTNVVIVSGAALLAVSAKILFHNSKVPVNALPVTSPKSNVPVFYTNK